MMDNQLRAFLNVLEKALDERQKNAATMAAKKSPQSSFDYGRETAYEEVSDLLVRIAAQVMEA